MAIMQKLLFYVRKYLILLIIVFIVIVLAIFYEAGFRVGPDLTLNRVGYLSVSGLPSGATIYDDTSLLGTSTKTGTQHYELIAGTYSLIVSVPGDYPWSTTVAISSAKTSSISPILVSETLAGKALTGTAATQALAAIASTTLPTTAKPLAISGACATVYVENNQLIENPVETASCTPPPYLCIQGSCAPTIVYSPLAPIDAVLPFPGRNDSVVILLDHSLYAIALNPESPQFFAPIGHGEKPSAGVLPDGTIVVSDTGNVSQISL
jgi:hypothetical protein